MTFEYWNWEVLADCLVLSIPMHSIRCLWIFLYVAFCRWLNIRQHQALPGWRWVYCLPISTFSLHPVDIARFWAVAKMEKGLWSSTTCATGFPERWEGCWGALERAGCCWKLYMFPKMDPTITEVQSCKVPQGIIYAFLLLRGRMTFARTIWMGGLPYFFQKFPVKEDFYPL